MTHSFIFEQGFPYPLGATITDIGVNFAIFSEHAKSVTLCLFDPTGQQEIVQYTLTQQTNQIWHALIINCPQDQIYGYRIDGVFQPKHGLRFDHSKLLIDPYAKKLIGDFTWTPKHFSTSESQDNASATLKSQVQTETKYQGKRPNIPWPKTVIYECHTKGTTKLHQDIPQKLQGRYLGLCSAPMLKHFKQLGINCVELLPVHAFIDEEFTIDKQLSNYWGYNSINFFTPHQAYSEKNAIDEFKQMVATFHQNDIEVILDVVFNHTAEGNEQGPTLSFKGIDNQNYYKLHENNPEQYINDSGCGNSLNLNHPRVLQLVMDSLRYWVQIMGVDGFRFDLAVALGREQPTFNQRHSFFQAIAQDPILSHTKLIAEPWDLGFDSYQVGNFPQPWHEWNDKFRDTMRRFWRGDLGLIAEFAQRLHGSSDLFEHNKQTPQHSINFITSHDGFSLTDLVSYQHKHNLANGENNDDGHNGNYSDNYGIEGPTDNLSINALRLRQQKNLLFTLILAQGTPMLTAGNELGHTQQGNNNAYCQDNDISWLNWQQPEAAQLTSFIAKLNTIRQNYQQIGYPEYIHDGNLDVVVKWLSPTGENMQITDWQSPQNHCLGYLLKTQKNNQQQNTLLMLFNADNKPINFQLPAGNWQLLISSEEDKPTIALQSESKKQYCRMKAKSSWLLKQLELT